ncbi:hypothetical protein [Terrarubrum flagellatum]|uniref:hypothetical protein n=1 Tax=Terrirubrum flagellatum TaxID=2895980 RepID=UPI00314551FF
MNGHAYSVGQSVNITASNLTNVSTVSVYKIVAVLPPLGADFQYRIRSDHEPHERVVAQSEIVGVLPASGGDEFFKEIQNAVPIRG